MIRASASRCISSLARRVTATTPDRADALAARYDALWTAAAPAVATGAAALTAFLDRLRALEPAQYYQPGVDLHHTVLSLFTATRRAAGLIAMRFTMSASSLRST